MAFPEIIDFDPSKIVFCAENKDHVDVMADIIMAVSISVLGREPQTKEEVEAIMEEIFCDAS